MPGVDWLWEHLGAIDRAASSTIGIDGVRQMLDALNDECGNCLGRRSQEWMDSAFTGEPRDFRSEDDDSHFWYHIERINAFAEDDRGLGDVKNELDEISRLSAGRLRGDE